MPLALAKQGEINTIKKIAGQAKTKAFLENLGFVCGGDIIVVSQLHGDLIVSIKNSRVAISRQMAMNIMI